MVSYQVEFSKKALKELRKIDSRYVPRIYEVAESLSTEPRAVGCRKLSGSEHTYRIRVGDYRIIYDIEDAKLIVVVIRVRHRQSAYET